MGITTDSREQAKNIGIQKGLVALFFLFWILFVFALSLVVVFSGGLFEALQILSRVSKGDSETQVLAWQNWEAIGGFVFLLLWGSAALIIVLWKIVGVFPKLFLKRWLPLLKDRPPRLFLRILASVMSEEVVFRWFPFAVLYPLWNSNTGLWMLVLLSSVIFGIMHLGNQDPKDRKILFVVPQIFGGIVLSGVFLTFGFAGAVAVHLILNLLLITYVKTAFTLVPTLFDEAGRSP